MLSVHIVTLGEWNVSVHIVTLGGWNVKCTHSDFRWVKC